MDMKQIRATEKLVKQIRPLLKGHECVVIGSALAEATAVWIGGHFTPDEREKLFQNQVATTRELLDEFVQGLDEYIRAKHRA